MADKQTLEPSDQTHICLLVKHTMSNFLISRPIFVYSPLITKRWIILECIWRFVIGESKQGHPNEPRVGRGVCYGFVIRSVTISGLCKAVIFKQPAATRLFGEAIFPFVNGRCHLEQSVPFLKQSLLFITVVAISMGRHWGQYCIRYEYIY